MVPSFWILTFCNLFTDVIQFGNFRKHTLRQRYKASVQSFCCCFSKDTNDTAKLTKYVSEINRKKIWKVAEWKNQQLNQMIWFFSEAGRRKDSDDPISTFWTVHAGGASRNEMGPRH